ncbi:MAG: ABC transporter permease [Treponema sp.]|jgi:osmoprotectant transport system permease protein|nr:ABC transporter permease [Treponema sp.]
MNTYNVEVALSSALEPYIHYFSNNTHKFIAAIGEHLLLSGAALLVASALGIVLGVLCAYNKTVNVVATGVFSVARIVPSLAILFLCLPLMGTGMKPSVAALTFLALPPILINTAVALASIPAAALEAARGMGMNVPQIFFRIKAPLALPLFMAGFKTAAVEVIASATLAAYIGGGGLGVIIFTGLGLMRTELLLIGGASVALLSLLVDFSLALLEKRVHVTLFGGAIRHRL